MLRTLSYLSFGALLALTVPACSSSDSGGSNTTTDSGSGTDTGGGSDTGGGTDTGGATDTGGGTDTGGATDTGSGDSMSDAPAGFKEVNGCTADKYVDATTDTSKAVVTPWGFDVTTGSNCIKIKKGGTVTWSPAPSATHPLGASGGDTPNPIMNTATNTFPTAGVFGYHCTNHASMIGAIWVVE